MRRREDGSAIVDFVLVGALLALLFMGVVQLALTLHIRNTLIDCAAEGARYAALVGNSLADGEDRTRYLIQSALADQFADDIAASTTTLDGRPVIEVTVSATAPALGFWGSLFDITVAGHALQEVP